MKPVQLTKLSFLATGVVAFLCSLSAAQEPKLPGVLARSPSKANTVLYLNRPALAKLMQDANMGGSLSDSISEVWGISDLDTESLVPKWEAGYATLSNSVDAKALAVAVKGMVDNVGGKDAVWTPRESYLVPLEDSRLGFLRPADRALLASWTDENGARAPISEYLAKQAVRPENFLSFMMAVDLENRFSPVMLQARIGALAALEGQDVKKVARIMAGIKGISLIVGRRSLAECILEIEHSESPEAILPIANKLLTEILNRNGTSAPEVASWSTKVAGNSIMFQGAISEESLDAVLGILSLRDHADQVASSTSREEIDDSRLVAYKSKQYFDRVNQYIERVRKYKAQTSGFRAKWNDQQARRIEEISTLNVDEELANYGASVASMLRGNAVAIQQGNIAAGQAQASSAAGYGGYGSEYYGGGYYGNGYGNAYSRARGQASIGAQQRMASFGSYKEALAAIDTLTSELRRQMTEKYNMAF